MLRYSHVALKIANLNDSTGREITGYLGVKPTKIQESKIRQSRLGEASKETLHHIWSLESPKNQEFQLGERVEALLETIAPFSSKLISLDSKYRRWIDLVWHTTPQRENGTITGEFDWIMLSPSQMSRMGAWNLQLSYEKFWFEEDFYKKRLESKLKESVRRTLLEKMLGKKSN
jgi:hypothetical protein